MDPRILQIHVLKGDYPCFDCFLPGGWQWPICFNLSSISDLHKVKVNGYFSPAFFLCSLYHKLCIIWFSETVNPNLYVSQISPLQHFSAGCITRQVTMKGTTFFATDE